MQFRRAQRSAEDVDSEAMPAVNSRDSLRLPLEAGAEQPVEEDQL